MQHRVPLQERIAHLGELGRSVFVINDAATRAHRARDYVTHLSEEHPSFRSAITVLTSISLHDTIERIRDRTSDDSVQLLVPVGGDTTFNAAFAAAEGTSNVVVAMRAGNATNAAINLQRQPSGRILDPHEVVEAGKLAVVHGIEMHVDDSRHLAATIADVGSLSRGARALNTWIRGVPGYKNDRVRSLVHERSLLLPYTALQRPIPVTGTWSDGSAIEGTTLGISVANAGLIGHYAVFPQISLTEPGAFAFQLAARRDIPRYARQIQTGTLPGHTVHMGESVNFRVGRHAPASVDGEHFVIEAGQRITYGISSLPVYVLQATNLEIQTADESGAT